LEFFMEHYKLAFIGFGNVGQALARLLQSKEYELKEKYNITFSITAIATGNHGQAIDPNGIDVVDALRTAKHDGDFSSLSRSPAPANTLSLIRTCKADVLFENSPVNYKTGQPAVKHIRTALECGMHALTANKGPVVHAYHQLTALADKQRKKFYFESTVMDGAPIFALFRSALPAANVHTIKGVLNSTTNMILTQMEGGESFDDAVAYCQKIGIAETDPSGDVDGWDAAIKLSALITVLMGIPTKPTQIQREGIRDITLDKIATAKAKGMRWKLVCTARREGMSVHARVAPEMVGPESPLYTLTGTTSIAQFETNVLGMLSIIESDPSPQTTAYGLLADLLNAISGK
jgi:homoserine dehydrogenase